MKKIRLLLLLLLLINQKFFSQVTIGSDKAPETFCNLQLDGAKGGLRLNNLTTKERNDLHVANNVNALGLIVYNTDSESLEFWDGKEWRLLNQIAVTNGLTASGNTVKLGGLVNEKTTLSLDKDLSILNTNGKLGIGTENPLVPLHINGTTVIGDNPMAAKLGIGITTPSASLHVNGTAIVADTPMLEGSLITAFARPVNTSHVVQNNENGQIGIAKDYFFKISVPSKSEYAITLPKEIKYEAAHLSVYGLNACGRFMNTLFTIITTGGEFAMPLSYVNAVARDIVGVATRVNAYKFEVKFPGVAGCQSGEGGTQFDFTIDTSVPGKITLTNNSETKREYLVKIIEL